jgi:high affinity sulfate transporter 1
MTENDTVTRGLRLPLFQGLLPIERARVPSEIIAGVTLAALAIPEVLGYTKIAGTPPITGLYTMLIPMILFAAFGSSRHLVVSADSATAAILAAGLLGLASTGSDEYVALAGVLALMAAVFLFLARVVGLGFLADFLSSTVLVGFLTGVGVQVALGQIGGMLGLEGTGHGTIGKIAADLEGISQTNTYAVAIAALVLAVIIGASKVSPRIPGALVAVVGATAASWALDRESRGVHILGPVPSGLPTIGVPQIDWSWDLISRLVPVAFAMFVVILAQSAATSRAFAGRYKERFSEDKDLVGLGMANVGAAFSGTFVVAGSPTKTQMVDGAGGRSQLTHLTTVLVVVLVLFFLTGPLSYMPEAVLAAVVFMIGLELIKLEEMRRIYSTARSEFWVALLTAAIVVFVGVEQGIIFAMVLSLLDHVRRGYRPRNSLIATSEGGGWCQQPLGSLAQYEPGLMAYRFSHSLYYANAALFSEQVVELASKAHPDLEWFCLDAAAIDDVDYTGAAALNAAYEALRDKGIRLVFTLVSEHAKKELDRLGITGLVGNDAFFATGDDVIVAFRQREKK